MDQPSCPPLPIFSQSFFSLLHFLVQRYSERSLFKTRSQPRLILRPFWPSRWSDRSFQHERSLCLHQALGQMEIRCCSYLLPRQGRCKTLYRQRLRFSCFLSSLNRFYYSNFAVLTSFDSWGLSWGFFLLVFSVQPDRTSFKYDLVVSSHT